MKTKQPVSIRRIAIKQSWGAVVMIISSVIVYLLTGSMAISFAVGGILAFIVYHKVGNNIPG